MDGRELRNCFGKFPTGVTIVSWFDGSVQKGITVNSFTSVSLDPPLALVSIHKEAKACTGMKDKAFTINILSDEQESIAWQFAGSNRKSKAAKLTSKTAEFTSKAAKLTSKTAEFTSKIAKLTSKAAKLTSKTAEFTNKIAKLTSKATKLTSELLISRVNRPNARVI
jgi:DNA anti-recombination protein RmuC